MRLLGLSALELGATLLACAAAILLLYLLRRPARQVVVPALSLWRALVPEKKRLSARFQRLRGSLSLLLALAIAALLAFALSDPERGAARARRNLLLLIDRSASMAASDLGPSRLERAKAEARALVRGLRAGDHASIAALDGSATPLTGFSGERAELLAAIERVTQSDGAADLLAGARLARDLLAARENPELVLFSDGSLSEREAARRELAAEPAIAARHVSIGQSGRNVGIANFSLRRYPRDKTHHESPLGNAERNRED